MTPMRFADLWLKSVPIPWVDHEHGWLAAVKLPVELRRGKPPAPVPDAGHAPFFAHPLPGTSREVEWWHLPGALYFNHRPEYGHFLIQHSVGADVPHRVIVWPEGGISRDELGDHLLRRACSLLLQLRGCLLLHASAVIRGERAIVFIGASGHGKSALAGAFLRNGSPVLGDEMIPLGREAGRLMVMPGLPMLDLDGAALRELGMEEASGARPGGDDGKHRVHLARGSTARSPQGAPLGRVFHLSPRPAEKGEGPISLTEVPPRDGFVILLANSYNNVLREPELQRIHLHLMADIINRVKITRLAYHQGRVSPHALREAVAEHLDQEGDDT